MSENQAEEFNWSKWGTWATIVAFGIATILWWYQTYSYNKSPKLTYQIFSNEEILTIKEDIPDLKVLYQEKNIKENNQNISVVTFRVSNNGNESILTNLYDPNKKFGFKIINGKLLYKPTITQSSDIGYYDEDEFFDLKCLIIHDKDKKPNIAPIGKIAGIKSIEVSEFKEVKGYEINPIFGFASGALVTVIFFVFSFVKRNKVNLADSMLIFLASNGVIAGLTVCLYSFDESIAASNIQPVYLTIGGITIIYASIISIINTFRRGQIFNN